MIRIGSEADNSIGMMESARRLEALECKCKVVAEELGATVTVMEDKFIIEGTLSGWFKYFAAHQYVNMNTAKVYVITTYPFYDNEPEIEMYVGDSKLSDVLQWRSVSKDEEEEITVSTMTIDELLQDNTPCWTEVGKELVSLGWQAPLKWFYLENHHQKMMMMTHTDLWSKFRKHQKSDEKSDDLPF